VKVLEIENGDFKLSVRTADVDGAYAKARKVQGVAIDSATTYSVTGNTCRITIYKPGSGVDNLMETGQGSEAHPVFYENKRYDFEISFSQKFSGCLVYRKPGSEADDFYSLDEYRISGSINFGNDIGKSELVIRYQKDNVQEGVVFMFEVFPIKLNYKSDFRTIVHDIEKGYPFLVLHFFKKTYSTFRPGSRPSNDLIWWQIFGGICHEFITACRYVLSKPHARLMDEIGYKRFEHIRRLSREAEERLFQNKEIANHYIRTSRKVLSVDTPENRFLKYAVGQVVSMYRRLKVFVVSRFAVSEAFKEELDSVELALVGILNHSFFKKVSAYSGLRQESLVLQRASGYNTVYRCWIMLQQGFSAWDGLQKIQLKNIAELYQIWCFIQFESILEELLGQGPEAVQLGEKEANVFNLQFAKGQQSIVTFKLNDGRRVDLYYEYNVSAKRSGEVVSYTLAQRPDIVLRITKNDLSDQYVFTYVYDAKYRLEADVNNVVMDSPPEDAINQMHRYRDAIYSEDKVTGVPEREVIGSYVLFPGKGSVDGFRKLYYQQSIPWINIGAYPLAPNNAAATALIREHLVSILNGKSEAILKDVRPQKKLIYENPNPDVLIAIVFEDQHIEYFKENPEFYHTGKNKPTYFKLRTLKYFCPYIRDKGVCEYYEIKEYKLLPRNEVFPVGHVLHKGEDSSERLVFYLGEKHIIADGKRFTFPIRSYKYMDLATLRQLSR